jgi:ABC-2 type transport system ATP-binding protein
MLEVIQLYKQFDSHQAVNGLSFTVQQGEFFGLLGPNGAGKSTTIHMISGIMPPDKGNIVINGKDLYTYKRMLKLIMGVVPQEIALYDDLSALQNLIFWGGLYGLEGKTLRYRAEKLIDWVGLSERKKEHIANYSGGMKRRINIAAALMHNPSLILMDEPTVGIDPQSRNHIYDMLKDLHKQGKTIIYTTHYMNEAEDMCDRIGIIDHGQLIGIGGLPELKSAHAVEESFIIQFDAPVMDITIPTSIKTIWDSSRSALTVFSHKPQQDLSEVIRLLHEQQLNIQHIEMQHVNLETIFLNLTGRTLRD